MAAQPAEAAANQATPGQREPSMEEILASIRRIIEDSDNNRAEANAEAPAAVQPTIIPPAANSSKPAAKSEEREVDTFRRELAENKPVATPPVAAATPIAETTSPAKSSAAPAAVAPSAGSSGPAPAPRSDMPARVEKPLQSVRPEHSARSEAALTTEVMQREWRQRLAMPLAPTPLAAEAVVTSAPPPVAAAPEAGKGGILSEVAGRQVAAAFGELSDAFAATRRRSFDEVAEDMLRPMLQEWLDNNLPTLVERLVREEIERVARGNPR